LDPATVGALKFETAVRASADAPVTKLTALAELQRSVGRAGFAPEDAAPIAIRIGEIGGMVEAEARLTAALGKASAPVISRLTVLLRFAAGEACPLGPAADRAKAEVLRLLRSPENREAISRVPDVVDKVRGLLTAA
jgi:hypothetical protein